MITAPLASAASGARDYLEKSDEWYRSTDAARVAASVLSYQSPLGGWPKNTITTTAPYAGRAADLKPTFDNGATTDELRFLARMYGATKEERYKQAFLRGLDYILKAQYPTGGWPQSYPPGGQYHRHITFNDNAMVRLMRFVRDVAREERFAFVDAPRRELAAEAFERGVRCILRCQIRVDGKLMGWCAQHDEKDYRPRAGRSYELASISGSESVEIVRLLMSIENPSDEVIAAVRGAVEWFEAAKLPGIRVVRKPLAGSPKGYDQVVAKDPSAPPMWARFYEIGTNRPIFCDRDGVAKGSLEQIGYERRNGYSWLGYWPRDLLAREYPAWRSKWSSRMRD